MQLGVLGFVPKKLGQTSLSKDLLKADFRSAVKIGACGIGKKAVYLNSFFFECSRYVATDDIRRIFKRIAMTKNGFTGKGVFGSLSYLVLILKNGDEIQCSFKYEADADSFLKSFHELHPSVPVGNKKDKSHFSSANGISEQSEAEMKRELSHKALASWKSLDKAYAYLNAHADACEELSNAAKNLRIISGINPKYRLFAMLLVLLSFASIGYGIYSVLNGCSSSFYCFILFGFAFLFYALSLRVLPIGHNSRRAAVSRLKLALKSITSLISDYGDEFPVPAQYAHPVVISRMIRALNTGIAESISDALAAVKEELRALNSSVSVSQQEYDEITAVKPLFLVFSYEDDIEDFNKNA